MNIVKSQTNLGFFGINKAKIKNFVETPLLALETVVSSYRCIPIITPID